MLTTMSRHSSVMNHPAMRAAQARLPQLAETAPAAERPTGGCDRATLGSGQPSQMDLPAGGADTNGAATTHGDPEAVAQQIAQEATGWTYDYSGGKTWGQAQANEGNFDSTKAGVCVDMANQAAEMFEQQGVEAKVVMGETGQGGHAWVEYKGSDGQWKRFDPTAAACTKDPGQAINTDTNAYGGYGKVTESHDV